MSTDPVMLAMAELAKQVRELTERVSYLEHARAQDAQRIDAHGMLLIERASRRRINKEHQS